MLRYFIFLLSATACFASDFGVQPHTLYPSDITTNVTDEVDKTPSGSAVTDSLNLKMNTLADNSDGNLIHSSFSSGRLWGGEITTNEVLGKINIAAGAGLVKDGASSWGVIPSGETNGQSGSLSVIEWEDVIGLDLAGTGYNLIYWDASESNFMVSLNTTFYNDFDFSTDFTIGRMYYDGTESTIRLCGMNIWNFPRRVQMFGEERFPVERANGLIGSASGLQYSVTEGVIWAEMVNRFQVDGKSLNDNFRYWYSTNSSYTNWSYLTVNTISSINYNGSSGLTPLIPNRWRCDYVYVVHDGSHHVVVGNSQHTSAANAQAAAIRIPPGLLSAYATLVGRITVQEGESTMTFDNATPDASFASYAIPDHNGLSGLQGGGSTEYYHLTAEEQSNISGLDQGVRTTDSVEFLDVVSTGMSATEYINIGGFARLLALTNGVSLQIKVGTNWITQTEWTED